MAFPYLLLNPKARRLHITSSRRSRFSAKHQHLLSFFLAPPEPIARESSNRGKVRGMVICRADERPGQHLIHLSGALPPCRVMGPGSSIMTSDTVFLRLDNSLAGLFPSMVYHNHGTRFLSTSRVYDYTFLYKVIGSMFSRSDRSISPPNMTKEPPVFSHLFGSSCQQRYALRDCYGRGDV